MRKIVIAALAAVVAVAGSEALAAKKKPAPQSFKATFVKFGKFSDTAVKQTGQPLCTFTKPGFVNLHIPGIAVGKGGAQKVLTLDVAGVVDPRSESLPATYTNVGGGAGVTGSAAVTTVKIKGNILKGGTIETKTTYWGIEEGGASEHPFTLTLTSYDPVTGRLRGKFSGTMIAADANPDAKPLKVTAGKFLGDTVFSGL